jgi:hypothetical protein
MASTGQKIATGCGIGCLLLVIIVGGVGTCSYLGVRKVVDEAESLEVVYDELTARHGAPEDYTPPADGRIQPYRLELFLAIRDSVIADGDEVDQILRTLDGADGSPGGPIAKVRAGMKFVPATLRFMAGHSGILLRQGMGLGEYMYLYAVGYYAWLGHDPGAGPDFQLNSDEGDENASVRFSMDSDGDDPRADRARQVRETLNHVLRSVLANQLAEAESADVDPAWRDRLAAEVEAMREDWQRLPWEDGLPASVAESLAPYREQFEATWSPYLNALELGAIRD